MAKTKTKPEINFLENPDNVTIGDWVKDIKKNKVGQISERVSTGPKMLQFWIKFADTTLGTALAMDLRKTEPPTTICKTVNLNCIKIDSNLQQRVKLDKSVVEEYAIALENGVTFPPITIWYCTDKNKTYLVDGFHRAEAAKKAGIDELPYTEKSGTYREALLYSVSLNSTHGLRRSNADKRKAVMTLLNDPEWSGWSNRAIASQCEVSKHLVNTLRNQELEVKNNQENNNSSLTGINASGNPESNDGNLTGINASGNQESNEEVTRTYITKDGVEATMRIGNIGKSKIENPDRDPDPEFNDGGFFPSDNYPEDNRYYPEDVIKDLWDDEDDSVSEDSVNEDSLSEDSVSKDSVSNNEDKPENTTPTSTKRSKHNKPNNIKRPQKKEIVIKEGLNYFAGSLGSNCKWYIEASEEDYRLFQEYQKEINAPSISTCLARMIKEKREAKIIHTDDLVVNLSSKMTYLNEEQRLFLAKQLLESDPDIFNKIMEENSLK